jgi:putative oxygen-independent coproporphyrinogen III oxidase
VREAGGLYVHLPYCASRCAYCAFVVTTDASSRDRYLEALESEARILAPEASGQNFDSLYLGGGTPSLLPPASVARLVEVLRGAFRLDDGAEATLEANPEDVTEGAARAWKAAGVNRVSVGVQSFEDAELSAVGRRHDAARAARALEILAAEDFSISGDLILGLPGQSPESFEGSVRRLIDSGALHASVYLLEVEKSKTMEDDRRLHPERYPSDDLQADMWLAMGETLASAGLAHYEISNWGRPGREARHNLKYWTRTPTLGLGVSAHEYWAGRRRANVSTLEAYLSRLAGGERPLALDRRVDAAEAGREEVFLGLRLATGVEEAAVHRQIVAASDPRLEEDYAGWLDAGILQKHESRVRFTERGFLVSNEILSRFV